MKNFGDAIFLTRDQHDTYMRRAPVRFIRKTHSKHCEACGATPSREQPLQHSHRIPFIKGVRKFALTPDFLDRDANIVSACRGKCNKSVEFTDNQVIEYLRQVHGQELPKFLFETGD